MGLDYVDIFYSHRLDPDTPLRETMGALDTAVRQGKALSVGISSYSAARTREAIEILTELGTPLLIHQPSYSLLNRWIEDELLDELARWGVGAIVFSPLGQGLLTDRYLHGVPADSRVRRGEHFDEGMLSEQSLAQMAIAWVLRDPRVSSALIGASSVEQLEQNVASLAKLDFSDAELAEIDRHARDSDINIWAQSSGA
jgi:L-glyceraldehyde 3-phosphate reductase